MMPILGLWYNDAHDAISDGWDEAHEDAWDEDKQWQICKLCGAAIFRANDVEKEHNEGCPLIKAYAAIDVLNDELEKADEVECGR